MFESTRAGLNPRWTAAEVRGRREGGSCWCFSVTSLGMKRHIGLDGLSIPVSVHNHKAVGYLEVHDRDIRLTCQD